MTNSILSHHVNISRSSSMGSTDRQPLTEGPAAERIQGLANNRLGAVYSALYNFWSARHAAVAAGQRAPSAQHRFDTFYSALYIQSSRSGLNGDANRGQEPVFKRRDSYSVILFDHEAKTIFAHDVRRSPDQLLDTVLLHRHSGGTDFTKALRRARAVMVKNWSKERLVA